MIQYSTMHLMHFQRLKLAILSSPGLSLAGPAKLATDGRRYHSGTTCLKSAVAPFLPPAVMTPEICSGMMRLTNSQPVAGHMYLFFSFTCAMRRM